MKDRLSERQKTVIAFFLLAVMGCVIGWVYEMLFYRIDMGYFIRRGQGFGPWLPIYGFGALGLTAFTYKKALPAWLVFIIAVVGSFIIEFGTGYVLFHYFDGLRLWDYNTEIWNFGNIGGYVCLRSVLIFGVMGVLFVLFAIPWIRKLVETKKTKLLVTFTAILAVIFFADIIYGYFIHSAILK